MNEKDRVLYEGKWFSVIERKHEFGEWVFVRQTATDGVSVAAMPYRVLPRNGGLELGTVVEIRPPWGTHMQQIAAITGMYDDKNKSLAETAQAEMYEEAGIPIEATGNLFSMGWSWDTKIADTKVYLFGVDVTGCVPIPVPVSQRHKLEKYTELHWQAEDLIHMVNDPLIAQMYVRLLRDIKRKCLNS